MSIKPRPSASMLPASLICLALILGSAPASWAQDKGISLTITIIPSDKARYLHFMADKKPIDRMRYKSPDFDSSSALDLVLLTKALTLGGLKFTLDFLDVPNTERERAMVLNGDAVLGSNSQWDFFFEEHKDEVYRSDQVIPSGSFEKGLYTTRTKAQSLKIRTAADLASLSCVSSSNWRVDWGTLKNFGFQSLADVPTRDVMFKLVGENRADLTVQSFSGNDKLSITDGGYTLYPIPGVKILLKGSRYYMVSKKHPHGAAVFAALQKGLAIMAKDNEINRALTESGFFNQTVKNWTVIKR